MIKKIVLLLLFTSSFLYCENLYEWKVTRVIDGDTVEIEVNFLPAELGNKLKLRVFGVDTPESNFLAKSILEKNAGLKAKLYTQSKIKEAKLIQIKIYSWDKYGGRVLGDVILDGESLKELLIKNNYAKEYDGKKKSDWTIFLLNQQ